MKDLQKAIEEIKEEYEMFYAVIAPSINPNADPPYNDYQKEDIFWNKRPSEVWSFFETKLTQLITSREQEIGEETIMKCMALVNTHTEHNGSYCDTGEDMDWACRSECVDMAEARLEQYLSQQKENK